ncbi:MAG: hypothetical protein V1914_00990 [archaeon]
MVLDDFEITYTSVGKAMQVKKSIMGITDAVGKNLIGTAMGDDLAHCVYIAWRSHKNFFDEVNYYRFCTEEEASLGYPVTVEFYK